jgi:hypothetical protein
MKTSNIGKLAGIAALLCTFGLVPQPAGAAVILTGCAGGSFNNDCGLDELLAGGSITINETRFSNFSIATLFGSRPIASSQVRVDTLDDQRYNPGLTLVDTGNTLLAANGDFTQSNLTFTVSILPGSNIQIKDNSLAVAIGNVSGGDLSFIDVNENVFTSDIFNTFLGHKEVFCDTTTSCANTTGTDQAVFALVPGVNVSMGIDVSSFDVGDVAAINTITARYSEIPVPGSLALVLLGLGGAGSVLRRRHAMGA